MAIDDKMLDGALDRAFEKAGASASEPAKMPELGDKSPAADLSSKPKSDPIEDRAYLDESQRVAKEIAADEKKSKEKPKKVAPPTVEAQTDNDQDASAEPTIEPTPEETPAVEAIPAPAYWSAEGKAAFTKAPPELQKAIAAESLKVQQQTTRLASEANRGKLYEQRIQEVFGPYELKLKANGVKDWSEATERLLFWNELFEKDPFTGISDLMQKNGLTPHDFINGQNGQQYQQSVNDPRVDEALQAAKEAKELSERYYAQLEEQKTHALNAEINTFKQGKDSRGQVREVFAQNPAYAPQIDQAYQVIVKNYPGISTTEALDHAYEYVLAEATKYFGVPTPAVTPKPPVKTPEQVKADAQKVKAATSSVTGAPSTGAAHVRPKAVTVDEAIDRAFEKAGI